MAIASTRKQRQFCYILLLCLLWHGDIALAQEFAPVNPVETLVQEVANGTAEITQFQALQKFAAQQQLATDISLLLADPNTETYLDENFDSDGYYGETAKGLIITDWEPLAKGLGTTAAILAGAYAVWRRRRQDYLARLRAGESGLIEDLFMDETGTLIAAAPNTKENWAVWAQKKGIPGAGALLPSLYALLKSKRARASQDLGEHEDFLAEVYEGFSEPMGQSSFRVEAINESQRRIKSAQETAYQKYISENPVPLPPTLSENLSDLQNINQIFFEGLDLTRFGVPADETRKYTTGLHNQLSQLISRNDQPADITAAALVSMMQNLQRGGAVIMGRNNPDFSSLYLGTTLSHLDRTYKNSAQSVTYWLNQNQAQIQDRDLYSELLALSRGSVYANQEIYKAEAASLQPVLALQKTYKTEKKDWDNAWATTKSDIARGYNSLSYDSIVYWQHRYAADADETKWQTDLNNFSAATDQGLAKFLSQKKSDLQTEIGQIFATFSLEDLTSLFAGVLDPEPVLEALELRQQKLDEAIEKIETRRGDVYNLSRFMGANGYGIYYDGQQWRRQSDNSKHNVFPPQKAIDAYNQAFDREIDILRFEFERYREEHHRQKIINSYHDETRDLPAVTRSALQSIELVSAKDEAFLSRGVSAVKDLRTQINILEKKIITSNLRWSALEALKRKRQAALTAESNILTDFLDFRTRQFLMPGDWEKSTQLETKLLYQESSQSLEKNKVDQWLSTQRLDRNFYKKYGIMDREAYLSDEIAKLENIADQMVEQGLDKSGALMRPISYGLTAPGSSVGSYYGYEWMRFSEVERDLEILRAGALPDQNWSTTYSVGRYYWGEVLPMVNDEDLRLLYYRYASSPDQLSRDKWELEIEAKEAELFAAREAEWEAQQTETLEAKFTTEEITAHQALKSNSEKLATQSEILAKHESEKHLSFIEQIKITNRTKSSPTESLLPFLPEEVTSVSFQVISTHFEKPLWEAFRRYQTSYDDFVYESGRLIEQAKKIDRREAIQKAGIPAEPVMTKEIRDYLDDPVRTAADIDIEVAEIRANIPALKSTYAGQPYLQTALDQAEAKIQALLRYKAFGPVAAAQYEEDLAYYNEWYAPKLTEIDQVLDEKYVDWADHTQAYFATAGDLLAQRTADNATANQYVPTDPDLIEYVETLEEAQAREALEKAALDLHFTETNSDISSFNPAFASTQITTEIAVKNIINQGTWDEVSNQRIAELNPLVQAKAAEFVNTVESELGIQLRVASGLRSHEEQDHLYAQGRTVDGAIVTHAPGGESYHNYGQAIDVVAMEDGVNNYDLDWEAIGAIGKRLGFAWGGDWSEFPDRPHFEMSLGQSISDLKLLNENNFLVEGTYYNALLGRPSRTLDPQVALMKSLSQQKVLSQAAAELLVDYAEESFQSWRKYQPNTYEEDFLRAEFLKSDSYDESTKLYPKEYDELLDLLEGVSVSGGEEIKTAYSYVILHRANGTTSGEDRFLDYINMVRESDQGVFTYEMASWLSEHVYGEYEFSTFNMKFGEEVADKYAIPMEELVDEVSGLDAQLYENEKMVVLSFQGTQDIKDLRADLEQGAGFVSDQYRSAVDLARYVKSAVGDKKLYFTGHSLGGGLAAVAAVVTGERAITVNAAGVHPNTIEFTGEDLTFFEKMVLLLSSELIEDGSKKLLHEDVKTAHEMAKYIDENIPEEYKKGLSERFANIDNYSTAGEMLTSLQNYLPFVPQALGEQHVVGDDILGKALALVFKMKRKSFKVIAGFLLAVSSWYKHGEF